MGKCNISVFIISGFSDIPTLQLPIFGLFLCIYFLIICGNLIIIGVIWRTPLLHTPMYFFLVNLSFIDIASASNILPKLLVILYAKQKTISFLGCITQLYIFMSLTFTEIILFAVMAYDRYVAICHPLHYFVLMPFRQCARFSFISWFIGFLDPTGHVALISKLSFCLNNYIDHFFCDINPLLHIACKGTAIISMLTYIEGTLVVITAFMLTLISYIFIISTILKIQSSEGQRKAFSTCTAHLTCVTIFYGTLICLYMRPTSNISPKQDKYFSLFYVVLVPIFNPIIYSLKNKDVKKVLIDLMKKYL
ncbi:olfactory receptor 5AP2-like [Leptodactylus fuscus]|uniref:olfactory receptor 5AP2-like n=1 Tax=Leptodactylus fuscus TaxID=238119 RepID=UPI003F4E75A2